MDVKISIEVEIKGKKEALTYEEGEALYNELKKVYDKTITIGGRDFLPAPNPWRYPDIGYPPPTVLYGVMPPHSWTRT